MVRETSPHPYDVQEATKQVDQWRKEESHKPKEGSIQNQFTAKHNDNDPSLMVPQVRRKSVGGSHNFEKITRQRRLSRIEAAIANLDMDQQKQLDATRQLQERQPHEKDELAQQKRMDQGTTGYGALGDLGDLGKDLREELPDHSDRQRSLLSDYRAQQEGFRVYEEQKRLKEGSLTQVMPLTTEERKSFKAFKRSRTINPSTALNYQEPARPLPLTVEEQENFEAFKRSYTTKPSTTLNHQESSRRVLVPLPSAVPQTDSRKSELSESSEGSDTDDEEAAFTEDLGKQKKPRDGSEKY
jgi:hypothetical protein